MSGDRIAIYHSFDGVTLHNDSDIRQVPPLELSGDMAVTRIFRLSNATKFDADGDADGDTVPGNIRAVFRVTGATHEAAVVKASALEACLNKKGMLYSRRYGASSWTARTCTARCTAARQIVRAGLGMASGYMYQIDVELVWERFTDWTS